MAKLKDVIMDPTDQSPEMLKGIIEGLFPCHDPSLWTLFVGELRTGAGDEERVPDEELAEIAKSLSVGKVIGPDRVPILALKGQWLDEGVFPEGWKRQTLVLLPRAGKPTGDPLAYRPINLIDTVGKVLEKIILKRMLRHTVGLNGISNNQYGFQKGRSNVNVILSVINTAEIALQRKRRGIR